MAYRECDGCGRPHASLVRAEDPTTRAAEWLCPPCVYDRQIDEIAARIAANISQGQEPPR
jgi:hypothetical protein